jgi:Mannosyltransferase putative
MSLSRAEAVGRSINCGIQKAVIESTISLFLGKDKRKDNDKMKLKSGKMRRLLFATTVVGMLMLVVWQVLLSMLLRGGTNLGTSRMNHPKNVLLSTNEKVTCVAWRATDHCVPDGPRLSHSIRSYFADTDLSCRDHVPSFHSSGYCELRTESGRTLRAFQKSCSRGKEGPFPWWKHFAPTFRCDQAVDFINYQYHARNYRPEPQLPLTSIMPGGGSNDNPTRGILLQIYPSCLPSVYTIIKLLRDIHHCQLPIELWHTEGEISDTHPMVKHLLETYDNMELRTITTADMAADSNSYMSKPFAIAYSRFDQILFLDSDNFPFQDPTFLFETPEFKSNCAMFWKDFWNPRRNDYTLTHDSLVWELLGIPVTNLNDDNNHELSPNLEMEMESGQMVIDRRKSVAALQALLFLSKTFGDWFEPLVLVWGDKDMFRLAYYMTSTPFHFVQEPPGLAGKEVVLNWVSYDKVCGITMVQHAPNGDPIFFHRNIAKLSTESDLIKVWRKGVKFVGSNPDTQYAVEGSRSFYRMHGCYHPKVSVRKYFEEIDYYSGSNVEKFEERILGFAKEGLDIIRRKKA